jgi:hypothetical protein
MRRDFSTPPSIRYLRFLIAEHEHRLFAGNHRIRQMLTEQGLIETVSVKGNWAKLRPTEAGRAAAQK